MLKIIGPDFSTFVRSIELICKFKSLPYELTHTWQDEEVTIGSPALAKLHPYSKVPVLIDGDFILPESNAIARYLDPRAKPSMFANNPQQTALIDAWAGMLSEYVYRDLISLYVIPIKMPQTQDGQPDPILVDKGTQAALASLEKLEAQLGTYQPDAWFMGSDFSLADAILLPMLDYINCLPAQLNLLPRFENLQRYFEGACNNPHCQAVLMSTKR